MITLQNHIGGYTGRKTSQKADQIAKEKTYKNVKPLKLFKNQGDQFERLQSTIQGKERLVKRKVCDGVQVSHNGFIGNGGKIREVCLYTAGSSTIVQISNTLFIVPIRPPKFKKNSKSKVDLQDLFHNLKRYKILLSDSNFQICGLDNMTTNE